MQSIIMKKYLKLKQKICSSRGFDSLEKYSIKDLILIILKIKTPKIKLEEKIEKEQKEVLNLIKQCNINNKIIDKFLLKELYRVKSREYRVEDICMSIQISPKKTLKSIVKTYNRYDPTTNENKEIKVHGIDCVKGACNFKGRYVVLYYDSILEASKKRYDVLKSMNKITIKENEFINSQIVFVLLHELTHASQVREIRKDTANGKILADCFKEERNNPKMNREEKIIERMADVNAINNLNILADRRVFSKELKLYTRLLKTNLLKCKYNYQLNRSEYPSDRYNLTDTIGNCDYERVLNGFRIPEENYKKLVRKISD